MNKTKILILGGGGYVGGALTKEFLRRSEPADIVTFDCFLFSDPFDRRVGESTARSIVGDIRDAAAIRAAMEGVDVLIHLACLSNDACADVDCRTTKTINYTSLEGIMKAAVDAKVGRVIYASSSSVYGDHKGKPCNEYTLPEPLTGYAKYKWQSELAIRTKWSKELPCVIIRPATLCGWTATGMRYDLMFNSFVAQAICDGVINVRGGHQKRSLLSLTDMVELYAFLAFEPCTVWLANKVWNVVMASYTIGDLALLIAQWRAEEGHRCSITFAPSTDKRSYDVIGSKIEEDCDWTPRVGIKAVYEELSEHLTPGGLWDTAEYIRVRKLGGMDAERTSRQPHTGCQNTQK